MNSNPGRRDLQFPWTGIAWCGLVLSLFGGCGERPASPENSTQTAEGTETNVPPAVFEILDVNDDTFQKQVLESPIPVLADFGATWCGPCRMLEPDIKELAKEFHGKVRFVKIDIDESPRLGGRFVTQGIPLVVVFRKGKAIGYSVGADPGTKSGLSKFLQQIDSIPEQPVSEIDLEADEKSSMTDEEGPVELRDDTTEAPPSK